MKYNKKYNKQQMVKLQNQGKTYIQIATELNCSEWTVKYHLIKNRKTNSVKYYKQKSIDDPLFIKRRRFLIKGTIVPFSLTELRLKIGNNPKCYLTGESIDLNEPSSYSLDHIIPISRGGKSSLDNLGLIKLDVNLAKYNLTPDEFVLLCKRVVNNIK